MDIEKEVIAVINKEWNYDGIEISLETSLSDDLNLDSLDEVELTMTLEDYFDIEIEDFEAQKIKKVGQVVEYIKSKLEK